MFCTEKQNILLELRKKYYRRRVETIRPVRRTSYICLIGFQLSDEFRNRLQALLPHIISETSNDLSEAQRISE